MAKPKISPGFEELKSLVNEIETAGFGRNETVSQAKSFIVKNEGSKIDESSTLLYFLLTAMRSASYEIAMIKSGMSQFTYETTFDQFNLPYEKQMVDTLTMVAYYKVPNGILKILDNYDLEDEPTPEVHKQPKCRVITGFDLSVMRNQCNVAQDSFSLYFSKFGLYQHWSAFGRIWSLEKNFNINRSPALPNMAALKAAIDEVTKNIVQYVSMFTH